MQPGWKDVDWDRAQGWSTCLGSPSEALGLETMSILLPQALQCWDYKAFVRMLSTSGWLVLLCF